MAQKHPLKNLSPRVNRFLTILFGLAVLIQLGYLLIGLASNFTYYQRVTSQTVEPKELYGEPLTSNAIISEAASERRLSLEAYAVYHIVLHSIGALIPAVVAFLIIWHIRWQWFAWFTAFILLFLGQYALNEQIVVAGLISLKLYGANDIFWFLILLFILLFPNGRVVPRKLGWVVIGLVVYHFFIQVGTVVAYFAPEFAARVNLPNWGSTTLILPVLFNFLIVLICQVYRYLRVSNSIERQQTKWFLYGFGVVVALVPIASGNRGGYFNDLGTMIFPPLPIALAFAILRYRLWDIDVIIRKTLVYSVVTGLLALVYFGSVLLLQGVFSRLGIGQSPVALVLSTLAIAALFNPLLRRVQQVVDRRFYRKKYDAEQVLAAFSASARDEVDMDRLSAALVKSVDETVQPERTVLWMARKLDPPG